MLDKPPLHFHAPHRAGRRDRREARKIVAAGRFVQRAQQRLRKRIAYDRHARDAVLLHGIPDRMRIEIHVVDRDDGTAGKERHQRRHESRAVHERARRQRAAARRRHGQHGRECVLRVRHFDAGRAMQPVAPQIGEIAMPPHHAFGHARGAAGVDENHVVRGALDAQRQAFALFRQHIVIFRERRKLAVVAHFDEGLQLGERIADLRHRLAEFGAVNDRLRIRIVDDVAHLVGLVAVVDVHMGEPGEQAGADAFRIFRAVPQVERDLVAGPGAAGQQRARQIVHAPCGVAPADRACAVNESRGLRRDRATDDVQQIPVIPLHNFHPIDYVPSCPSLRDPTIPPSGRLCKWRASRPPSVTPSARHLPPKWGKAKKEAYRPSC